MANYSLDTFIKTPEQGDKKLFIYDNNNNLAYVLEPLDVNFFYKNNKLVIHHLRTRIERQPSRDHEYTELDFDSVSISQAAEQKANNFKNIVLGYTDYYTTNEIDNLLEQKVDTNDFNEHVEDQTIHFKKEDIYLNDLYDVNTGGTIEGYYLSYSSGTWIGKYAETDLSNYYTSSQTNNLLENYYSINGGNIYGDIIYSYPPTGTTVNNLGIDANGKIIINNNNFNKVVFFEYEIFYPSQIEKINQAYFYELCKFFDMYKKFNFEFNLYTSKNNPILISSETINDFNTIEDFFMKVKTYSNDKYLKVIVYAKQDLSLEPFMIKNPRNLLYAILRGRGKYVNGKIKNANYSKNKMKIDVKNALINEIYNFFSLTVPLNQESNAFKTISFTRKSKKLYKLFGHEKIASLNSITYAKINNAERWCYNIDNNKIEYHKCNGILSKEHCGILAYNSADKIVEMLPKDRKDYYYYKKMEYYDSACLVYPCYFYNYLNEKCVTFYIKPIGLDTFIFNKCDYINVDNIYAVCNAKNENRIVRKINNIVVGGGFSLVLNFNKISSSITVNLSTEKEKGFTYSPEHIRDFEFFYMLPDGRISNFTKKVYHTFRNPGFKMIRLIK